MLRLATHHGYYAEGIGFVAPVDAEGQRLVLGVPGVDGQGGPATGEDAHRDAAHDGRLILGDPLIEDDGDEPLDKLPRPGVLDANP